jgi:hypothetical protein
MVRIDWPEADRTIRWSDHHFVGSSECGGRAQRPPNVALRQFGVPAAHGKFASAATPVAARTSTKITLKTSLYMVRARQPRFATSQTVAMIGVISIQNGSRDDLWVV